MPPTTLRVTASMMAEQSPFAPQVSLPVAMVTPASTPILSVRADPSPISMALYSW